MKPYSDEYMTFDKVTHRYVLTEKDVLINLGINLQARVKNENAIQNLLRTASAHVYSFLHSYNTNNEAQDYVLATTETGRAIIKQALERQLTYILVVGDLTMSVDDAKRSKWFDVIAEEILYTPIPEIGNSILYTGNLRVICDWSVLE